MSGDTVINISYSSAAIRDLEQIGDYIAERLNNSSAALRTVNRIQDRIDKLANFPLMGAPISSVYDIDTDYRFLVCGKYLAFYQAADNRVLIVRVLYARRDYIAILFGDLAQNEAE